jgi:hypothetical protein
MVRRVFYLLLLLVLTHAHISSSDSKVSYGYSGEPLSYHLFFSLETGLGPDDFISVSMPLQLHNIARSEVRFRIVSFDNNLEIGKGSCESYGTNNQYYLTVGKQLSSNRWYELIIFPNRDPAAVPFYGLVQV